MKNISTLVLTIFIFSFIQLNAQDVEIKKGDIFVDGTHFLSADDCKYKVRKCPIRSVASGERLFAINYNKHAYYNAAAKKYVDRAYLEITFIEFDLKMTMYTNLKKFVKLIYNEGLIDKSGLISKENAEKFARMYHETMPNNTELIIR